MFIVIVITFIFIIVIIINIVAVVSVISPAMVDILLPLIMKEKPFSSHSPGMYLVRFRLSLMSLVAHYCWSLSRFL